MAGSDKEEGFLSRWSKRKGVAREDGIIEEDNAELLETETIEDDGDGPAIDAAASEEMLDASDFDDVDFDKLDKSSDYTRFIKANVPASIQQQALRKLWASDPVFEVLDGMNDYDEDFTGTGLAGKVLKTAHKIGRGFLDDEDDEDDEDGAVDASDQVGEEEFKPTLETAEVTGEILEQFDDEVPTEQSVDLPVGEIIKLDRRP